MFILFLSDEQLFNIKQDFIDNSLGIKSNANNMLDKYIPKTINTLEKIKKMTKKQLKFKN